METKTKPKTSMIGIRVTEMEKALIFKVFGDSNNMRKFLIKAIQNPDTRERIKEVRNDKQQ
jgi:hypothetical protein